MPASSNNRTRVDIKEVAAAALQSVDRVLARWIPDGKRQGPEWVCRNPTRNDKHAGSFSVNMESGQWAEFASNDKGGDLVSLVAYLESCKQGPAAQILAEFLGIAPVGDHAKPKQHRPPQKQPKKTAKKAEKPARSGPIVPIPAQLIPLAAHPRRGKPSKTWEYKDAAGNRVMWVYRFEPKKEGDRKQFLPLTYWSDPDGWQWKSLPEPRPLYHLDQLAARPLAKVMLCEGEKAADAAAELLPEFVTTTTMNGAQSPNKADWSPVAGRVVLIWPDNDQPGKQYADKAAALAYQAGAVEVFILRAECLAKDSATGQPRTLPAHWDAADAVADGWTSATLPDALEWDAVPQPEPEQEATPACSDGFEVREDGDRPGVYWVGVDAKETPVFVCSVLRILAKTRDESGENWGRWLEWVDPDKTIHQWAMPNILLAGAGDEVRRELLGKGVELAPGSLQKKLFLEYLNSPGIVDRAVCVSRTGWHGNAFVFPESTLGNPDEDLIFQTETLQGFNISKKGELDQWRETVAGLCTGNSRLVFAVALGFAALLLELSGDESGGFHIRGSSTNASSSGKTTTQKIAVSVFGPPQFMQRWRATANGLENMALCHNDLLLVLDELGSMEPREAGEAGYMLSGGRDKARSVRSGGQNRPPKEFRLLFLSSGEVGLEEHMSEGGRKTRAGQQVRMAEIPADAGAGLGVFENLHGSVDGAEFARRLTDAAAACYGTAGPAFVENVVPLRDTMPRLIKELRSDFVREVLAGVKAGGQENRVAARFGLVAVAGELATSCGVTGWPKGEAKGAAARCFKDWLEARGGAGSSEEKRLIAQVRGFLEAHGSARFEAWDRVGDDHAPRVMNRVGYVKTNDLGAPQFYCFSESFSTDVIKGFTVQEAAPVLINSGLLIPSDKGEPKRRTRGPDGVRFYYYLLALGESEEKPDQEKHLDSDGLADNAFESEC